jgi:hypothetical protein
MLLQTNSYVVPKEKRVEHARLVRRFRQALARHGCDQFEVYEQTGTNWSSDQTSGRFVQVLRFRDRREQLAVQAAERNDPVCQAIIAEFCELINFPYQQQQGLFAIGYYSSVLGPTKALPQQASVAEPAAVSDQVTTPAPANPPVAQEVMFGEIPLEGPDATAAPHQAMVDQPVGKNGESLGAPPETGAETLDEMIKRRFGELAVAPVEEPGATQTMEKGPNGQHESPPSTGSGIGEVLDAVSHEDFDFDASVLAPSSQQETVHPTPGSDPRDSADPHG